MTEINNPYRAPSKNEQLIIERCVLLERYASIEMFIFYLIIILTCIYLMFLFFTDGWFLGIGMLFLSIIIGLFLLTTWITIKESSIKRSYKIYSDKGEWSIKYEGATVRTKEFVSKVNGKNINLILPTMASAPKYKEPKHIEYEYVQLFENSLPIGSNFLFISIDGKKLNEKDKDYIKKIKPVGLLSVVLSIAFIVLLIFSIMTGDNSIIIICFVLLFPFIRTVTFLSKNRTLRKSLIK